MYKIGFDVGGSKIATGIVDENKVIIARIKIPFPKGASYKEVVQLMAGMVSDLCRQIKIQVTELNSIGISIPGDLNKDRDTIINAHNLGFHNVPLRTEFKKYFPDTDIRLANDADAAALAELHAGVFKGYRTALLLTLGTGVGGGLILCGKMFEGGLGHGVEPGHMCLQHNGPLCTCGNRGCIETLCSATWLIKQGRKAVEEHPSCMIAVKSEEKKDKIDAKLVIDCAKEGDSTANDIFNRYVDQLSSAIVSCAMLLDPEIIALGGGVSLAGEFLFKPLRLQVQDKSFFKYPYQVVPAKLGNDAGIIGAAMLAEN